MSDEKGIDELIALTAEALDGLGPGLTREAVLHEFAVAVRKAQRLPLPGSVTVPVVFTGPESDVLLTLIDNCLSAPSEQASRRMLGGASDDELLALRSAEQKLQTVYEAVMEGGSNGSR